MPFGGVFWAVLTGIAFVIAGLAILSGIRDVLAARLLALMLLVFSAFVLTPMIFALPRNHVAWGGNAYNLAAVGAAWIVADWLTTRHQPVANQQSAKPAPA
jgi:surface polysaccharide O-acyltransferase-like enzyme